MPVGPAPTMMTGRRTVNILPAGGQSRRFYPRCPTAGVSEGIHRQHRLAQPALGLGGDPHPGKVCPHLDDGVDIVPVEIAIGVANLRLCGVGDQARRAAFHAGQALHLISGFLQILADHLIAQRLVRGEDRDPLCPEDVERGAQRVRPHGHADPGPLLQFKPQAFGLCYAAPESLQRDAHYEVVRRAGHDLIDGRANAAAHGCYVFDKGLFARQRTFRDRDARYLVGHAARTQIVRFRLNGCVGGRHHDTDDAPPSQAIYHALPPNGLGGRSYMAGSAPLPAAGVSSAGE
jgi:hypothetical protein